MTRASHCPVRLGLSACALAQLLLLVLLGTLSMAGAAGNVIDWKKDQDRVSVDLKSVQLEELLSLLSESTGWQIFVQPQTQHVVDVKFQDRPASEALKLLLGDLSYALISSTEKPPRLMVFRTGIGEATERVVTKKDKDPREDTSKPISTELVVTVKQGVDIDALAKKYAGKVIGRIEELRTYRLEFETAEAAETARKELEGDSGVEKVQNNYYAEKPPDFQGVDLSSLPEIGLKAASPDAADCTKIIIGLIDTTVPRSGGKVDDLLMPQIDVAGASATGSGGPPHGRAMAEAIARAADFASKGKARIWILPINVYGANEQASTFNVAIGIQKAIGAGAKIINLSLGSAAPSPLLADIIRQGRAMDIIFIAAAGNTPTTKATFPAADPSVLAVTASDRSGQLASYANRGDFVDVIAPGSTIFQFNGQSYFSSGTSVATAYVSGLASAMVDPCKGTYRAVEAAIRQDMAIKR